MRSAQRTRLSRREFIKWSAIGVGGALLTACGTQAPVPDPDPTTSRTSTALPNSTVPTKLPSQKSPEPRKKASPGVVAAVPATSEPAGSPILGRPTHNSVALSLRFPTDQLVVIALGEQPGRFTRQVGPLTLKANQPQQVDIGLLAPNTRYYYTLILDGNSQGEHVFHTQRQPGSDFTFTIDADPHNRDPNFSGDLYETTLKNVLADRPDFHINLGDTFMTEKIQPGTYAEVESTFTDMRPYYSLLGADVPLYLVNGNHDGELGWLLRGNDQNLAIWSSNLRRQHYPNPIPNDFYTGIASLDPHLGSRRDGAYGWTWGDALFIALDPFWYTATRSTADDRDSNWNWTLGKEQYDWLAAALRASTARYRFLFIHHLVGGLGKDARGGIEAAPYFEWGGRNANGSNGFSNRRPGWRQPIHQLLVEQGVSAVFHGHDHVYVRQNLDGIIYQEMPQPNNTQTNNTHLAADYSYLSGDVVGGCGHLRVSVSPTQVVVEFVRACLPKDEKNGQLNREVVHRYTIS